jgi:hypothetical protein
MGCSRQESAAGQARHLSEWRVSVEIFGSVLMLRCSKNLDSFGEGVRENSPDLPFHSHNDSIDYANHLVEECIHWLSVNNRNFVKGYEEGKLEIVVACRFGANDEQYHLLFDAIPRMCWNLDVSNSLNEEFLAQRSSADGSKHFMLISNAYLVQCPEKVIASSVRLERAKERVDLFRDIGAASLHVVFELGNVASEGEVGFSRIDTSRGDGNAVASVIQGSTKIGSGVTDYISQKAWDRFRDLDLTHNMERQFRVRLDNSCVGLTIEEEQDLFFKVGDVFLSPRDFSA